MYLLSLLRFWALSIERFSLLFGHLSFEWRDTENHADVLRGSSRVPAPGTRDEPLRMSAWEASINELLEPFSLYHGCCV